MVGIKATCSMRTAALIIEYLLLVLVVSHLVRMMEKKLVGNQQD